MPVVTAVHAADIGRRTVAVVASEGVVGVVAAVVPAADVRRYPNIRELWKGAVANGDGELPALVVLAGDVAEATDELATAIAFFAPRTAVVLLHRADELEKLGAVYLRVVAAHQGEADPDASVEVVTTPTSGARLTEALRATAPAELTVEDCPPALAGPLDTPSPPTPSTPAPRQADSGPVTIAVASAKGGAGKSTTALALAATFARTQPGSRVCVVDLDVRDGQLATLLDQVGPTVVDLCADPAGITDATVRGYLVHDDRLGVWALLAPPAGSDAATESLVAAAYRDILATLRQGFDVVIVDCPVTYREPLIAEVAFAAADYIVAVTTLAVTSLAGVERMLCWLTDTARTGGLCVARHKIGVVVNGALNGVIVDRAQVAAHTAGLPVVAVVPHAARDILLATNRHRFDLLAGHPDLGPAYLQLAAWCAPPLPRPLVTSSAA